MSLSAFIIAIPTSIIFGIWQQSVLAAVFCQLFMHNFLFMAFCLEELKEAIVKLLNQKS